MLPMEAPKHLLIIGGAIAQWIRMCLPSYSPWYKKEWCYLNEESIEVLNHHIIQCGLFYQLA